MRTIQLICKKCNGILETDEDRKIFFCPYCGSKELTEESDAVKIEQMRNEAYKEVELSRQQMELEKEKLHYEHEMKRKNLKWWILGWTCFFPIPLTILIANNKKLSTKAKVIILVVLWGGLLIYSKFHRTTNEIEDNTETEYNNSIVESFSENTTIESVEYTTVVQSEDTASQSAQEIQALFNSGDYSLVTPAFKETMDSYETFFDQYISFMNKYKNSNGTDAVGMLGEYAEFMAKYSQMISAMDKMKDEEMTTADSLYYTMVTVRIQGKLLALSS